MKLHDVVDGIIKERYETRDANDGDRLSTKGTEDYGRKGRRQKSFVDTVEPAGLAIHVQNERYSWQKTISSLVISIA